MAETCFLSLGLDGIIGTKLSNNEDDRKLMTGNTQ